MFLESNTIYEGDCLDVLKPFSDDSIDTIITDPPYGYSFMNKHWDKAVIGVETWKQCLRVLKPGAFAAVMSSSRQDVLARMICNLQDAGFRTDFTSIYWTFASGFPKASNVSKLVDKRMRGDMIREKIIYFMDKKEETINTLASKIDLPDAKKSLWDWTQDDHNPSEKSWSVIKTVLNVSIEEEKQFEREIIGQKIKARSEGQNIALPTLGRQTKYVTINETISATNKAKELDGSYAGFQPKPALEVVLLVMKPLSEKSFTDQALKNGKGITFLHNCRIPFQDDKDLQETKTRFEGFGYRHYCENSGYDKIVNGQDENLNNINTKGRFPANLLVSDDVLNDGKITKSIGGKGGVFGLGDNIYGKFKNIERNGGLGDSGSFSRYFSLDAWFDTTFPFIITPKASSSERNKGVVNKNIHITVKPIKLMSYLITLLTRKNDIVLDPFLGSGTTAIAAKLLGRRWIGIEKEKEYINIANQRLNSYVIS